MLTIEELEQQLAELRAGLTKLRTEVLQQQGAIALAEHLLHLARAKEERVPSGDGPAPDLPASLRG